MLVARAGGLLAIAMAYRLAARLAGPAAGVIAARWRSRSPTSSSATSPAATPRACSSRCACGRSSATSTAAAATRSCSASWPACCGPEVWPLWALYGLWYVAVEWRGRPPWRTLALVGGSGLFTLVVWFVPEYLGSGSLLRAAERARQPNPDSAAFAASPFLEVFRRSASVLSVPVLRRRGGRRGAGARRAARALRGRGRDARGALDGADDRRRADDRGRLRRQPALRRAARRDGLHPRRRGLGRALPRWRGAAGRPPRRRGAGRGRARRRRRRSWSSTTPQFGKAMDRLAWEADLYGANLQGDDRQGGRGGAR